MRLSHSKRLAKCTCQLWVNNKDSNLGVIASPLNLGEIAIKTRLNTYLFNEIDVDPTQLQLFSILCLKLEILQKKRLQYNQSFTIQI